MISALRILLLEPGMWHKLIYSSASSKRLNSLAMFRQAYLSKSCVRHVFGVFSTTTASTTYHCAKTSYSTLASFPVSVSYTKPLTLVSFLINSCDLRNSTSFLTLCGTLRPDQPAIAEIKIYCSRNLLSETHSLDSIPLHFIIIRKSFFQGRSDSSIGCER